MNYLPRESTRTLHRLIANILFEEEVVEKIGNPHFMPLSGVSVLSCGCEMKMISDVFALHDDKFDLTKYATASDKQVSKSAKAGVRASLRGK